MTAEARQRQKRCLTCASSVRGQSAHLLLHAEGSCAARHEAVPALVQHPQVGGLHRPHGGCPGAGVQEGELAESGAAALCGDHHVIDQHLAGAGLHHIEGVTATGALLDDHGAGRHSQRLKGIHQQTP